MSDMIGKTLGQYQIVELIQDTGVATVYKGYQPTMNRYVTIEVLKSQDPGYVNAFSQQNEMLARIQHPHILSIFDSGQSEGAIFRVLRYAEGGILLNHLMQYYDLRKTAGLISGIVAGLETIHSQGLVNGNLQPGSIYLDESGQPMLTDFGLPRYSGTPITPYLSPEQIQGGVVDKRTDVYALGVLLYVLLSGEIPPAGVVVSLRAKRSDLSDSVEKVVFRAMAQNPDARFQSAQEFLNALITALQPVIPQQPTAQPQTHQPSAQPPARGGVNWAAIILAVVLVLVVCGGLGLLYNWYINRPTPPDQGQPIQPPVEVVPTKEPEQTEAPIEPPKDTQPPDVPLTTPEAGAPIQLPAVCNSLGFAGSIFLFGIVMKTRKRVGNKRKIQ